MPVKKDLKRRVRARMQKTGEAYTTARKHVLATRAPRPRAAPDHAALAGMSDAAVRAKTGRTWAQWLAVLDAAGAVSMPHAAIARLLHEEHGLPGWWSQTVTVGYERIRGLRAKGQRRDGGYETSKSKTFPLPVAEVYRMFATKAARATWLGADAVTVKKATKEKSARWLWSDGTPVEIYFWAKGPAKSQVSVQHRGLGSRVAAEKMRALWGAKLDALGARLRE